MAPMLGRHRHAGCGSGRCRHCADGSETRSFKRLEARQLAAEVEGELHPQPDLDHLATLGPLYDLSDCEHGCCGSPSCGERCTFTCHPAPS